MTNHFLLTTLAAASTLLAGCSLIPAYERPAAPVAPHYAGAADAAAAKPSETATAVALQWSRYFTDAQLQELIGIALANNRDLRVAALNLDKAQAQFQIQRSALAPQLAAQGNATRGNNQSTGELGNTFIAGITVPAWELDFFGRIRSLKSAALAQYFATDEARQAYELALVASVAQGWLTLLAEPVGVSLPRPVLYPKLVIDEAKRAISLQKAGLEVASPVVALCPGAEYGPAKRWPAIYAAELARNLLASGKQVWLFGSGKDAEIADEIAALAPGVVNLCGKTSLAEAIDLLSLAAIVVTNDSGLMHMAAALDRPIVAVYGSSSPLFTPPLSDQAKIVTLGLTCSPCFKRACPLGHMQCLNELEPQRVMAAMTELAPQFFAK